MIPGETRRRGTGGSFETEARQGEPAEGVAEDFETIIKSNDWQVIDSLAAVDSASSQ